MFLSKLIGGDQKALLSSDSAIWLTVLLIKCENLFALKEATKEPINQLIGLVCDHVVKIKTNTPHSNVLISCGKFVIKKLFIGSYFNT